jgi:hypothetical protein
VNAKRYPNWRVEALISGHSSIDASWTVEDFAALCIAAADQAGATVAQQEQIADALPTCPHPDCVDVLGHERPHTFRCDDGGCCEPTDADIEAAAESADYARERLHTELRAAGRRA